MKNFSKIMVMCIAMIFAVACSSDSEQEVKPVKIESVSTPENGGGTNGRVAYSSTFVIDEILNYGFVADTVDLEHFSYYMGGINDVTIHIRGDVNVDDKYKITYEGLNHVGEETIYNGYIPNGGVWSGLIGPSGLALDQL